MPQNTEKNAEAERDDRLVRRFQDGRDREGAFAALYDRYGPLTLAFLTRRIGNPDLAAELNQDLYIAVIQSLDRFRGESSFKTWLFRMAQNRLSNLRRRWRTHLDELPDAAPDDLVADLKDREDRAPDTVVGREEIKTRLYGCLAHLPEIQRAVVVGLYYDGVTLQELTERFAMKNKSGARATLIAAQRKLRHCLERSGVTSVESTR
jgi:RNA polymerase sigma-70 factor (ECF subfamily)